ncbi:DegT/DnrJ/EryC1/StrS family aminotransferase [Clostridium sp. 'deep sea']|uniref:DegT/DnrJ/EryC1/StrS family aminotransferase n=1 Tax=Clostridium sp. 'deep sea' TaxID=2779445 RepID=UPI00189684E6|nr:DegT/DnrJ/EryC1/StrS family aminotransferase [Clostridium sp. 'deep sea']QOR36418.1 DegT/DnrJ/EryC1/StrS family aminotransferase [Clostridium sp. 'deep sea']
MIPIAKPLIGDNEKKAVLEVLESGMLAHGKKAKELEKKFAEFIGSKHAVLTTSGTTALQLMLLAGGIKPGDKIITTAFTFSATADTIAMCGAVPVFVDIDENSFNISPEAIEHALITVKNIKAIVVVHLYGLPANMNEIMEIAQKYNVQVYEDAAQAHGASINGTKVGSIGLAGAFSFYPTKNMTCGGGGIITTNDSNLANQAALLANHGQTGPYKHNILGFNYRSNDIQAAIGIVQLKNLPSFNRDRQLNASYYSGNIKNPLITLPTTKKKCRHVYNLYTIKCNQRDKLLSFLQARGIGAKIYYPTLLQNQNSIQSYGYIDCGCKVANIVSNQVLSLPVHPSLTTQELKHIVDTVNDFKG